MKILLLSISFVFITLAGFTQEDQKQKIEEYLNAHVKVRGFSGSVLVAKGDNIIFKKGFGFANLEHQISNTPETRFQLASVTKQFTSMAILLLVNEGKIKLDGKITEYLTWYRKDIGDKVTIHQLLIHTSGIPGYTESEGFFEKEARNPYTPKEFIEKFCMKDLEFEPGTSQKYNNSAYYILGAIIEQVSGLTYENYISENIFKKLGMYNSGYSSNKKLIDKRAEGYSKEGENLVHADYIDSSIPYAAGSLYSTVEDMYLWDRSLYTSFLLPDKWRDTLFHNYQNGFGYGWMTSKLHGHSFVHHSGGIHGFSTHIARFTDDDICIITLGNTDFNGASLINMDIAAILFGAKYEIPGQKKSITVEEKALKKFIGTYELEKGFTIEVTVEGGKLCLQAVNQPKFTLLAETETDFFMVDYPISVSFVSDKKGKTTEMILHQNGDHSLKKIK